MIPLESYAAVADEHFEAAHYRRLAATLRVVYTLGDDPEAAGSAELGAAVALLEGLVEDDARPTPDALEGIIPDHPDAAPQALRWRLTREQALEYVDDPAALVEEIDDAAALDTVEWPRGGRSP